MGPGSCQPRHLIMNTALAHRSGPHSKANNMHPSSSRKQKLTHCPCSSLLGPSKKLQLGLPECVGRFLVLGAQRRKTGSASNQMHNFWAISGRQTMTCPDPQLRGNQYQTNHVADTSRRDFG
mmetsp:Transcript_12036/g.32908  ORF Transcript_12036/g.32908 Transcript_12036/m.32908 type:complete len:122 (-) Transcript_12036:42-407(-)|eukprot:1157790-Pelagomonas_calceolata.AAC.1